ncbi:4-hydroxy-tetrahydrodipicolinate synthase [Lacticaseibacillus absianus]|uniref:4-hydroxy-tetrahydrodipicolinate synthase n=1 Tax=Lacticaseibacillus absianus TaxID=2729623 RepID=UPI0015CC28BB|nr:4-hydroxy-tetrahydrodipicolinate synthase [Lacticaseibacillus absianus]
MIEHATILTALVTPFTATDEIDWPALDALVDRLIAAHTDGFVVGATTGESPTLTHDEKHALVTHVIAQVAGRASIVANVGTNNTRESAATAREFSALPGVDAVLAVTPYYNKPSQAGIIAHFEAIADASSKPVIIYNIPGRVVVTVTNETLATLAQYPNIGGVKQCTTAEDLAWLVAHTPSDFAVYTGEDDQTLAAIQAGARGVISVASHLYGPEMHAMIEAERAGDHAAAAQAMAWLTPRMNALFAFPSPEPVKAVLAARGELANYLRLPLVPLTAAEQAQVMTSLED